MKDMEIYDRNINKNNRNRLIRYMKMKDINNKQIMNINNLFMNSSII